MRGSQGSNEEEDTSDEGDERTSDEECSWDDRGLKGEGDEIKGEGLKGAEGKTRASVEDRGEIVKPPKDSKEREDSLPAECTRQVIKFQCHP